MVFHLGVKKTARMIHQLQGKSNQCITIAEKEKIEKKVKRGKQNQKSKQKTGKVERKSLLCNRGVILQENLFQFI